MKLLKACIAMAAFAALFVVPSIAQGVTLTSPTGTAASAGLKIQATNVAHSTTPTQTVMTTSAGNITCGTATITGELTSNGGANVEGNITTAEFGGTHGVTSSGHCAGSGVVGEQIIPTPSHTSDETKSLPWCMKAGPENTFTVRGGKCSEATRPVTFTIHGNITCAYEKASITGTYTTHPAGAIATITNQTFTKREGSSIFCPSTGTLHMAFTLETDTVSPTDVYIDK